MLLLAMIGRPRKGYHHKVAAAVDHTAGCVLSLCSLPDGIESLG